MAAREEMDEALKQIVVPALRARGYTGSWPHLRRIRDQVDLVTFQFDRYGGGFVIEAGRASKNGLTTPWGKFIPAEKLRAWDLPANDRPRLRPAGQPPGYWFRFDGNQDCAAVAREALAAIL